MRDPHVAHRGIGIDAACQIETIVRRLQLAVAGTLPLPSAAQISAASRARTQTTGYVQGMSGNSNWSMQALASSGFCVCGSYSGAMNLPPQIRSNAASA
jgi:hypothetical protein